jgi:CheY-like chemotaxis protein
MKTVLIVDHDPVMVQTITGLLKSQGGFLEILTAANGKRALEIAAQQTVDIVITGLRLPEVDGFELLSSLAKSHPSVRVIVTTTNASPMFRAKIKQIPAAVHLDQTLDLTQLTRRIFTELQIDYGGQVRGINLSSFLQMIENEERTCTMQINAKGKSGSLVVEEGQLIDARFGELESEAAALQILTWDNVIIDLDYAGIQRERKINAPLMKLLIESGKIVDEARSGRKNKRKHPRFDCLVAVDYDVSDWTYHCFLKDISLGGAYVETDHPIDVNQKVILAISAPNVPHCSLEGVVARRDGNGIGIRFDALSTQQEEIIALMTKTSVQQPAAAT